MTDFDLRVQHKAEEHLNRCFEAEDEPTEATSPAYAPFCGCMTCIVREVLMVCWDEMMEEVKREVAAEGTELVRGALPGLQLVRAGDALRAVPRTGDD